MALETDPVWNYVGGRQNALVAGVTQASGDLVLVPIAGVTFMSGTGAVVNITVPYTGFQGTVRVVPTGNFTWTTAGNIGLAGTAVTGRVLEFTYVPATGKWYPSYV